MKKYLLLITTFFISVSFASTPPAKPIMKIGDIHFTGRECIQCKYQLRQGYLRGYLRSLGRGDSFEHQVGHGNINVALAA